MKIKKILVSQPKPSSEKSPYYDIAEKYGINIVFRPFIKVEGLTSKEFRQQKISIPEYTAVIFTARTAIDHFFRLCEELRVTIPETMKYFCTTEAIALYLQKYIIYRKRKIFFGNSGKLDDLVPSLLKHSGEKFLFPVSDVHKEQTSVLEKHKINYTKAIMYRTVSNDFGPDEPFDYDMLLFFSPSGIKSLTKNFPDFKQDDIKIGTFGPTTAQAVRDAGLRLDIEAPSPGAPSMTAALDLFLKEQRKKKYTLFYPKPEPHNRLLPEGGAYEVLFSKPMNDHKLPKNEKLCSRTAIDRLFAEGSSFIVYPIRVVYRIDDSESAPPRFFINIPKRNFKRAVKRVYLRRRIREAYRLNKQILTEPLSRQSRTAHLAFLYLDKNLNDFHFIEKKVVEILERLARKIESQQTPS